MKAVIIGSGMSGLTAAVALAQQGHEVTLFEQYERLGGVTAPYEQDGYKWDLGQLLIEGMGRDEPLGSVLDKLGVLDQIAVRRDDRGYVMPDFEIRKPPEYEGILWRINRLKALFPQDAQGLDRYWRDYVRFTRLMTAARCMEAAQGFTRLFWQIRLLLRLRPLFSMKDWNAQQLMDHYFQSDRLKCVFISILADFFTPPSQFLGLGVFALNAEATYEKRMPKKLASGAEQLFHYSILGGISAWVDVLAERLRALGGVIHTSRPVQKIVIEEDKVTGVLDLQGIFTPAEVVVASGGVRELFFKLVGQEHLPPEFVEKVLGVPLMDSVFMVHLGIDFDPSPYMHGVCTYYYGTYDIEQGIAEARQGIYHQGRDGFVIHAPTLHSSSMAPEGEHALTIYTICPDRLQEGDWGSQKEAFADQLLAYAEKYVPGLRQHTRVRVVLTPDDFRQRTYTDHHAFGGLAPVMGAWKAPHETPVQGLWFVGAQSESGGGVNSVVPGAYRTALKIAHLGNQ